MTQSWKPLLKPYVIRIPKMSLWGKTSKPFGINPKLYTKASSKNMIRIVRGANRGAPDISDELSSFMKFYTDDGGTHRSLYKLANCKS